MNNEIKELDIIVPIAITLDWPTKEDVIENILELKRDYGFNRFALCAPDAGWRAIGYPSKETYIESAKLFSEIKNALAIYGVECGWWVTLTVKNGLMEGWTSQVSINGDKHAFAVCPMDEKFIDRFTEDIADFAKIAKPTFIFTEDDFTIRSANGCFCEHHLNEFAARQGRYYSREELSDIFAKRTPEAISLIKSYREVSRDALVNLASMIRKKLDEESPEIPFGYAKPGSADADGNCTEPVARAMAGDKHTPFSRICGAFYGEAIARRIPEIMHNPLYQKQHITENFKHIYEADVFPHTRFFQAGKHLKAQVGAAISYGFDGMLFYTRQLLDHPTEEKAYSKFLRNERTRLETVHKVAKECKLNGINIEYDPFCNTVDDYSMSPIPHWARCVGNFGIPYTTLESKINFWDERQARYYDDEKVLKALSGNLFLDGQAAKYLSDRGYSEYIGVKVGDDVLGEYERLQYDLGAREVICEKFRTQGEGKNMPSAHMFAPNGNGKLLRLTPISENCEVISELYTYDKKLISPAMTRFENSLGGKVVILGETLYKNVSQSLLNYRRQRLMQNLIQWCSDDFIMVKDDPCVYTIQNEATNPETSGFSGMLTLINLCEDELERVYLHLPEKWKNAEFMFLDENGEWISLDISKTDVGVVVNKELASLEPMYILIK